MSIAEEGMTLNLFSAEALEKIVVGCKCDLEDKRQVVVLSLVIWMLSQCLRNDYKALENVPEAMFH